MGSTKPISLLILLVISLIISSCGDSDNEVTDVPLTWTAKTSMPTPQYEATAATVEGKIYVIGGKSNSRVGDYSNSKMVQRYDPATDTWFMMNQTMIAHTSSVAADVDGKIYVISPSSNNQTVEEYEPKTDTWTTKSPTQLDRWHTTAAVVDGKIYVIGGYELKTNCGGFACIETVFSDKVEQYDPAMDTWTVKTPLPTARGTCVAAAIDGGIVVVGSFKDVHVYDPATDTWTTKSPMPTGRASMAAAAVEGKIYVIGGTTTVSPTAITTVEQYDPATDTWTTKSSMPTARYDMAAAVVAGKIYVIGGTQTEYNTFPHDPIGSVEQYNPAQDY